MSTPAHSPPPPPSPASALAAPSPSLRAHRQIAWCRAQGADVHAGLYARDDGRVACCADLAAGDVVARIPPSCKLSLAGPFPDDVRDACAAARREAGIALGGSIGAFMLVVAAAAAASPRFAELADALATLPRDALPAFMGRAQLDAVRAVGGDAVAHSVGALLALREAPLPPALGIDREGADAALAAVLAAQAGGVVAPLVGLVALFGSGEPFRVVRVEEEVDRSEHGGTGTSTVIRAARAIEAGEPIEEPAAPSLDAAFSWVHGGAAPPGNAVAHVVDVRVSLGPSGPRARAIAVALRRTRALVGWRQISGDTEAPLASSARAGEGKEEVAEERASGSDDDELAAALSAPAAETSAVLMHLPAQHSSPYFVSATGPNAALARFAAIMAAADANVAPPAGATPAALLSDLSPRAHDALAAVVAAEADRARARVVAAEEGAGGDVRILALADTQRARLAVLDAFAASVARPLA